MCTGIVQGCPLLPVYAGEIAGRCLGADVAAFDENGKEIVGELGELVIRQPMPSMAVQFWNDPGDERYCAAYFDHYPGIWRHGDWIKFTERGSSRDNRPLGRDPEPRRRAAGDERVLLRARGARRGRRQPGRPPRGAGRADPLRRPARGSGARRCHAQAHRGSASRRAVAASRAGYDRRPAGDPPDAHGQEARTTGQADPQRRPRRRGGQPGRARESRLDRTRPRVCEHATRGRSEATDLANDVPCRAPSGALSVRRSGPTLSRRSSPSQRACSRG